MTPPDSGEREVTDVQLEILRYAAELRVHQDTRSGVEVVPETILRLVAEVERGRKGVLLPLSLAHRILAAMEGNGNAALRKALADELRAVIPK